MVPSLPLVSCESSVSVKENPDGKKNPKNIDHSAHSPVPSLNVLVTIAFKYFSNFWRSLDLSLINVRYSLICCEKTLYSSIQISCLSLFIYNNLKFLENLKQRIKRTVSRNKYRSEVTRKPKCNNLHYIIDLTFRSINSCLLNR